MYGVPLNPSKTEFEITNYDGLQVWLSDLEDPGNDGVREVDHPMWDVLFGNDAENVFSPYDTPYTEDLEDPNIVISPLVTKDDIRRFCLSIGMTEGTTMP